MLRIILLKKNNKKKLITRSNLGRTPASARALACSDAYTQIYYNK
jgi:hypothetical protein